MMGLKNYTTTIDVQKTLGEITKILVKHGARQILQEYDQKGRVISLKFSIQIEGQDYFIKLPSNISKIFETLKKQRDKKEITGKIDMDKAEKVAWRIIKDWIDAQMAILETQMVVMEEIFLPYIIANNNQTFFEAFREKKLAINENNR